MKSPHSLATITLIIGNSLETLSLSQTTDIKSLAQSIVRKHNLTKDAVPFLESNIRGQLEKNLKKIVDKSPISEMSTVSHDSSSYVGKLKKQNRDVHFELYKKGMDFLERKREKEEILRRNKELQDGKELTFRPKTTSFYEGKPPREKNIHQYEKGIKMTEEREKTAERIRKESLEKSCSFHPKISEKTVQILKEKGDFEPNFDKRLYKLKDIKSWREQKIREMYTFKPNLNQSTRKPSKSPRTKSKEKSPNNKEKATNDTESSTNNHYKSPKAHLEKSQTPPSKNIEILQKSKSITPKAMKRSPRTKNLEKTLRSNETSPSPINKSKELLNKSFNASPHNFDGIPKITKDHYYYEAKQKEIDEMARFRKKLEWISENDPNFRKKRETSEKKSKKKGVKPEILRLLEMVFKLLDSDGDGRISAKKCEIIQIHPLALEIIQDVLFEMETKRKIIDFEGFVEEVTRRELETKIWKFFKENEEKIDGFHDPQFSFGDYTENMKFFQKKENKDKSQNLEPDPFSITKHYKNLIKISFNN